MPVQLGTQGQPGFDQPMDLMMDCHRRIEQFLDILARVAEVSKGAPLDDATQRAVVAALRYFREAAPHHTADEEQSLFPRLRELDSHAVAALLEEADRLEAQHREAETLHGRVETRFLLWLDRGELSGSAWEDLCDDLKALAELYAEHIRFEDEVLFPAAERLLGEDDKRRIGREMETRRAR